MEKVPYGGWNNCIKISNGIVELIATADVGPRIIRFGFTGGQNEFFEDRTQIGKTNQSEWLGFGGHRLWIAPESKPLTYFPDSVPIQARMRDKVVILTAPTESTNGIQKEMEITLDPQKAHVTIIHRITNHSLWEITLAPWALSVMDGGGTAILPQEQYSPHPDVPDFPGQKIDGKCYLPVRTLALWSYTRLTDPRLTFTDRYMLLKQDSKTSKPLKIGFSNRKGWAAYAHGGRLFIKASQYVENATYPDSGCSFEAYTNSDMLEMETLGPLRSLQPGASVTHREDWYLYKDIHFENTDKSIDEAIAPLAGQ
jgi:hypothetical protein